MSSSSGTASGSNGNSRRSSSAGDSSEGTEEQEEDEDSSSSSSNSTITVQDALDNFREQWLREMELSPQGDSRLSREENDEGNFDFGEPSVLHKARDIFLKGVKCEQDGEHYEAIRYYKRAVQLVPDIEFRTFDFTKKRQAEEQDLPDGDSDEENGSISGVEDEEVEDTDGDLQDLVSRFSRLQVKTRTICEPEEMTNLAHISSLPMELLINILKWVVSSELDVNSLERCSLVSRGFYLASRSGDLWRLICVKTWGVNAMTINPRCWRDHYIDCPRVKLNGCYIARNSYVREGERSFQDNEFYKSWHFVQYYRYIRFFAGGRVVMTISSEDPANVVKVLNNRNFCPIQGTMFGYYRTINDQVICVLHKEKPKQAVNNRFRRRRESMAAYDVPDQEFSLELEIKGKRNTQLTWAKYSTLIKYKNGRTAESDIDVSNSFNFPPLHFSRVKSYITSAESPLGS